MKRQVYEAALRRLTKRAGGKLRDDLRDEVRELAADYVESKAKALLAKIAEFAHDADLDEVLESVGERIERRGAEAEDFRTEALRRATQGDDDAGQQPADSDTLDGGDSADS